jgi:hypothetical protein
MHTKKSCNTRDTSRGRAQRAKGLCPPKLEFRLSLRAHQISDTRYQGVRRNSAARKMGGNYLNNQSHQSNKVGPRWGGFPVGTEGLHRRRPRARGRQGTHAGGRGRLEIKSESDRSEAGVRARRAPALPMGGLAPLAMLRPSYGFVLWQRLAKLQPPRNVVRAGHK